MEIKKKMKKILKYLLSPTKVDVAVGKWNACADKEEN